MECVPAGGNQQRHFCTISRWYRERARLPVQWTLGDKKAWMSEYGDWDATGLQMATCITKDIRELRPTAWCYWQLVDESSGWGMLRGELRRDPKITEVATKYYVWAHYTRHVRPGMAIIDVDEKHTVASYDSRVGLLVLVVINPGKGGKQITYDLSAFATVDGPVQHWRADFAASGPKYESSSGLRVEGGRLAVGLGGSSISTIEVAVSRRGGSSLFCCL